MHGTSAKSRAPLALVTVVAVAVLVAGCNEGDAADAKSDAPEPVVIGAENVVLVTQTEIASGPAISGALTPEREATVRAEISGPVLQTFADEGSRVSRGTLLARLDDASVRDAFLSARSALTTAQMSADIAQRELARQERLAEAGAIAERDLEATRRSNVAAQSQLADARARVTIAQEQLDDTRITAPFPGAVSARHVSAGDVVQPGGALYTIVDPSSMQLEAAVPAQQLSAVTVGAPVTFTVNGYPGRKFVGSVRRINPTADAATGQVRIVVSIPNAANNLVAGLSADGRVATARRPALTAPQIAVDLRSVKPFVVRLKNGKAERVDVEIGLRDEETEQVEIRKGVGRGDTLLIGAALGITPGTVVKVSTPSDVEKR